jgi:hypothetical protein
VSGVRMSWVTLDRIVSKEALSDEAIRRQLEQDARPLRSHTAGMGDEDLLAKLRGLGVDADREKLANLCAGALSAEEVVSERLRLHDRDADWAWICLAALWGRWWPDKVCLELLDDKVQAGYETDQRNDFVASGRIWLDAWSDVLLAVRRRRCQVDQGVRRPLPDDAVLVQLVPGPRNGAAERRGA